MHVCVCVCVCVCVFVSECVCVCVCLAHNTRRNCRRKCRESSDMILHTALLVMCLITSIKVAFMQAIQSGKIYKHCQQVLDFTSEHLPSACNIPSTEFTDYERSLTENEWIHFQNHERQFRKGLDTKLLQEKQNFVLTEDFRKWSKLFTVLNGAFFRTGIYSIKRTDGRQLGQPLLKYVVRILRTLPLDDNARPKSNPVANLADWIEKQLRYLREVIQPAIASATRQHQRNPQKVGKNKLTYLWQHRRAKAIDIILNYCMFPMLPLDPGNTEQVYNYYWKKSQSDPTNITLELPPWKDELFKMAPRMAAVLRAPGKLCSFSYVLFVFLLFYVLDVVSITVYDRDTLLNIGSSVAQRKPDFEFLNAGGLFTDTASEPFVWVAKARRRRRCRKRGKRAGVLIRLRLRAFRPPLPTILLANVQSLDNKLCELRARISYQRETRDCCVICLTETWMSAIVPDSAIELTGFSVHRSDRTEELTGKSRGGGVCFYINNSWCNERNIHSIKYSAPLIWNFIRFCVDRSGYRGNLQRS